MRITKLITMALCIVATSCYLQAADTEGFRDMKWGDSPTKDMIIDSTEKTTNTKMYHLKNDKLNIGDAQLTGISYTYFDNKFMSTSIKFKGYANYSSIKSTLETKYGNSYRPNKYLEKYWWFGGNSTVGIIFSTVNDEGIVFIMNTQLSDQSELYKKNNSSNAAKDL